MSSFTATIERHSVAAQFSRCTKTNKTHAARALTCSKAARDIQKVTLSPKARSTRHTLGGSSASRATAFKLHATDADKETAVELGVGAVTELDSEEQYDQVLGAHEDKLLVLNCSTTWCGPCKVFAPVYQEISAEYPDVGFLKMTGDKNNSTVNVMKRLSIRAVPCFKLFKNGEELATHSGTNKKVLIESIEKHM